MKNFVLSLSFALLVFLCACSGKDASVESSPSPTASMNMVSEEEFPQDVSVPNPITEAESLNELNNESGGLLSSPTSGTVSAEAFHIIDCGDHIITQYEFSLAGYNYCYRFSSDFNAEISGVYHDGKEVYENAGFGEEDYREVEDHKLCRWVTTDGQYVLSVSNAEGLSTDSFLSLVNELHSLSIRADAYAEPVSDSNTVSLNNRLIYTYDSLQELNSAASSRFSKPVTGSYKESFWLVDFRTYQIAQYNFYVNALPYSLKFCTDMFADLAVLTGKDTFELSSPGALEYLYCDSVKYARWATADGQYVLSVTDVSNILPRETFEYIASNLREKSKTDHDDEIIAAGKALSSFDYTKLAGSYADSVSQRAVADVESTNGTAIITVHWSGSAFEYNVWTMTLSYEGNNKLTYTNCCEKIITTNEQGEDTANVVYENGSGYFEYQDGALYWTGAADEMCSSCIFTLIP